MGQRLELQILLQEILGNAGGKVYFQPPSNVQMEYPSIVYSRDSAETLFAGNNPYRYTKRYQVTVIDSDPDSEIPDKVAALPMCTFATAFVADNLNHSVYNLYF